MGANRWNKLFMHLLLIWMDKQKIKIKILIGLGYRAKIGVGSAVLCPFLEKLQLAKIIWPRLVLVAQKAS